MWSQIKDFFKDFPAQQRVARILFERGFQTREDGKVVSGRIEIPHTQIAKEAGVERRAVDSTVQTILSIEDLKRIYMNLKQVCSLEEVAREFNLSVIVFVPKNASEKGIIANVTRIISENGLVGKGNMKLLLADKHVFDGSFEIDELNLVSLPQLIIDLFDEGGVCVEAAEKLLEKVVRNNVSFK